ncbi:MAG: DUF4189 domain-containing protein [Alphaproteobacteria bacterium]|nr:DUF4189 domain-containing protein [Alphaproteobacteria bacterium]
MLANLPRAFAVSENGKVGWAGPAPSLDVARAVALERCATLGGINCRWYAENLDVVWVHRPQAVSPPPAEPLIKGEGYVFIADDRYFWRRPRAAAGETFGERFGACLYRFASSPVVPSGC